MITISKNIMSMKANNEVCRTCLHMSQTYTVIFEHYESNKLLSEMLTECTSVKVEHLDGLPVYMCNNCMGKLTSAWNFKLMAIESDRKFKDNIISIENNNTENVVSEDMVTIKEEETVIKLEELDLSVVKTEDCDNDKPEYVVCDNRTSQQGSDSVSKSEDNTTEDKISISNEKIADIKREPDDVNQTAINIFGFNENGVPMTKNGQKLTRKERDKVPTLCKPCNRYFSWKYYRIHSKHHSGDRPYKCDICNKAFTMKHQLTSHQRCHSDELRYSCKICEKRFKHTGALSIHKQTHSGDRPHKCKICGLAFKYLPYLRNHIQRHTKERVHMCEVCGKSFMDIASFNNHKLTHLDTKMYPCPTCGRKFTAMYQVKKHEKQVHKEDTPYVCNECGRRFKQRQSLRRHMLIHTGEKPYSCNICGKQFRHRECLPGHMRMHTGETPYSCEKCPATYKHLSLLKKHLSVHAS